MPLSLTVDPVPAPPATPTASVTAQPNCHDPHRYYCHPAPTGPTINTVSGSLPILYLFHGADAE
ncbi:MAG: hypothetical protein R2822_15135 [Spirosomataceae bacterium]